MQPVTFFITEICSQKAVMLASSTEIETATRFKHREVLYTRSIVDAFVVLLYEALNDGKKHPDFLVVGGDEWYRLAHELGLLGKEPGREITLRIPEGVFRCIRVKRECLELGYLK